MFEHGRECVRLRAGRRYNPASGEDDALDWSPAAVDRLPIPGSIIAPSSMSEPVVDDENTLLIRMSFYGPHDVDIRHRDRLLDPGIVDDADEPIVWEVTGDVAGASWTNPFTGWQAGSEIPVEQVR